MKKGGIMKKYLLSVVIIVGMLIIACGNEPPEEHYEGTPEDIAAISSLLDDYSILMVIEDIFDPNYIPVALPPVAFTQVDSFMRNDPFMIKQHVDSCNLNLPARDSTLDYWFTRDTTCTVRLFDTLAVWSRIHADANYTAHYDSALCVDTIIDTLVTPPETTFVIGDTTGWRIATTDTSTVAYYDSVEAPGDGLRMIFFEPRRDAAGDLIQPLDWQLKRVSYGLYYFPQYSADIPDIEQIVLIRENGENDTIFDSNTDEEFTGHAMNRLKSIDSLIRIDTLDLAYDSVLGYVLEVSIGGVDANACSFFASCNGERVNLQHTGGYLPITGEGITNLCFEVVNNDIYYYVLPEKEYEAEVWLIPVEIGGVQ